MNLVPPDRAQGLRRSTAASRAACSLADGFAGLPEGVTRWRLAAALRAAARSLMLGEPMLRLLEHYIDQTYDIDWEAGSEPVICRPVIETAEHLGKSERQIRNIERALVERGLLAWRDSGNHHRKGRRDRRTGRLLYAYGPSLAPLGQRAAEIIALAAESRRALAETRRVRLAIAALRRRIRTDLAAAEAMRCPADDLATAFAALPERNSAGVPLAALEKQRHHLSVLADDLRDRLHQSAPAQVKEEVAGLPEVLCVTKPDTCKNISINGYSMLFEKRQDAAQTMMRRGYAPEPATDQMRRQSGSGQGKDTDHAPGRSDWGLGLVPLNLALAAASPELREAALRQGRASWNGFVAAVRERALLCDIDSEDWGEACAVMGRNGAALCAMIVERGMERPNDAAAAPVRHPRAYFRALIERARTRQLHLDRSIRGLADLSEPA